MCLLIHVDVLIYLGSAISTFDFDMQSFLVFPTEGGERDGGDRNGGGCGAAWCDNSTVRGNVPLPLPLALPLTLVAVQLHLISFVRFDRCLFVCLVVC